MVDTRTTVTEPTPPNLELQIQAFINTSSKRMEQMEELQRKFDGRLEECVETTKKNTEAMNRVENLVSEIQRQGGQTTGLSFPMITQGSSYGEMGQSSIAGQLKLTSPLPSPPSIGNTRSFSTSMATRFRPTPSLSIPLTFSPVNPIFCKTNTTTISSPFSSTRAYPSMFTPVAPSQAFNPMQTQPNYQNPNPLHFGPFAVSQNTHTQLPTYTAQISHESPSSQNNLIPKAKICFPEFNGTKPRGWIRRCEKFFNHYKIADDEKMDLVAAHIKGQCDDWFDSYMMDHDGVVTWREFCTDLCHRYGNEQPFDIVKEFNRLVQWSDVDSYKNDLKNCVVA